MAGRITQEMQKARKLVEAGATPYAAAKACGITKNAIYMAPWYKAMRDAPKPKGPKNAKSKNT